MMRSLQKQLVITFHTTAGAMAMEKLCKKMQLPGRLIPVPRNLTSDCGIAWAMPPQSRPALEQALRGKELEIDQWFETLL